MTVSERELMIAAARVLQRRGDGAAAWICGRIAELDKAGDTADADTWTDILGRLGQIESNRVSALQ